jgi:hypothetical protein
MIISVFHKNCLNLTTQFLVFISTSFILGFAQNFSTATLTFSGKSGDDCAIAADELQANITNQKTALLALATICLAVANTSCNHILSVYRYLESHLFKFIIFFK